MRLTGGEQLCDAPDCPVAIPMEHGTCSEACAAALLRYDADVADLNRTLAMRRGARFEADEARRSDWMAASAPAGVGAMGLADRRVR